MAFDEAQVRADFPILARRIRTLDGRERPLVYMDHGASTHAPKPVIDAVHDLLTRSYANIHRGNHTLSLESSDAFDHGVGRLVRFVGGHPDTDCAVLGQNTTMALDCAAHIMAGRKGATLTTAMEHHSNDLPHRRRGETRHAQVDDQGRVLLDSVAEHLADHKVKLLAVSGASNVTGYTPDLGRLARMAHDAGALFLVDAAQLYAHKAIDMKPEGHPERIDLLAAAGHKAYAPLGSAFLIGSKALMDTAPPYMPGGGTVEWVTQDSALFTTSPDRHMGGTPNIVGAVAFAAATAYLDAIGMQAVAQHEAELTRHALQRFARLESSGVRLLGPRNASEKVGVLSFLIPGVRHEMVSAILNHEHAIATRNGCFCAHPLLHHLLKLGDTSKWIEALDRGEKVDLPGATRATLGLYNTRAEVDALCDAVEQVANGKWKGKYETIDHKLCRPTEQPATLVAPR